MGVCGCTSGRNASLGEPAAYQASLHRFGVGMDRLRPPELRAVRDVLACSRWPRANGEDLADLQLAAVLVDLQSFLM